MFAKFITYLQYAKRVLTVVLAVVTAVAATLTGVEAGMNHAA